MFLGVSLLVSGEQLLRGFMDLHGSRFQKNILNEIVPLTLKVELIVDE